MTIVSIHQPMFYPYLGVFYKILKSDKFCFLDDAQYTKSYCFAWNKIKTPNGECRFHLPISYKFGDGLNEVRLTNNHWQEKMLEMLYFNYKRSEHFEEVYEDVKSVIYGNYEFLSEICASSVIKVLEKMNYDTKNIYFSSDLDTKFFKEQRVIEICKKLGATMYYSGNGAKEYQNQYDFNANGILLSYTSFKPKEYQQNFVKQCGFIANLSILDYLFNEGYNKQKILEMW